MSELQAMRGLVSDLDALWRSSNVGTVGASGQRFTLSTAISFTLFAFIWPTALYTPIQVRSASPVITARKPAWVTACAMRGSSVATAISSSPSARAVRWQTRTIMGAPHRSARGFPGNRWEA